MALWKLAESATDLAKFQNMEEMASQLSSHIRFASNGAELTTKLDKLNHACSDIEYHVGEAFEEA